MKGKITLKILRKIKELAEFHADFFAGVGVAGYGASRGEMARAIDKARQKRERYMAELYKEFEDKRKIQKMISNLKQQGILNTNNNKPLFLTVKGTIILNGLEEQEKMTFKIPQYPIQKDKELKIIIFDVPKEAGSKRFWLRGALQNLQFELIQKSVYRGTTKVPKEFIEDLQKFNLLECVHIFVVKKQGTLSKIKEI